MPMGDYKNFDDCIRQTKRAHPSWSKDRCQRYCGEIKHRIEGRKPRRSR